MAQVSNTNFYKNKSGSSKSQQCIRRNDSNAKAFKNLRNMKRKRPKNVFLGHLNINSIKNKFESVWELIKDTFDIFLLSESKLDSSFPDDQLSIPGYRIVKKDRDSNGGGLLLYINEDVLFKIIQNSSLPPKENLKQLIYPLKHFLKSFSPLWIDSLFINKNSTV